MRSKNSLRNVMVGWVMQFLIIVGGFVCRMVFVRVLSEEYLGIGGLFSNIIMMLSVSELGIGTAIIYSLYKPIAEGDREQIIALMEFYRKVYRFIGCFVLVVGSALAPFLPYLIKEMPDIPHIYLIYLMYVFNTGISYFYSYKSSFVNANQDYFIISLNHGICYCVMIAAQIVVLLTTHNFIAYFLVQIIATLTENLIIARIADKRFPILRVKEKYKIEKSTLKQIKTNTVAMMGHNIGSIVLTSTDNLVISKFVGLVEVGLYSNYTLIINSVNAMLTQAFTAITSSIGNLLVLGEQKQKEDTFYMIFFINFWLYGFCSCALVCLINPFIEICFGAKWIYDMKIVAVIVASFYCTGIRLACNTFKSAAGLYMQDIYKPYVEVVLNLVISIALVQKYGILGVLLGTVISTLAVNTWIEPMVLYKYELGKSPWKYFGKYIWYMLLTIAASAASYWMCGRFSGGGIGGFIVKCLMVIFVPNVIFLLISFWTKEFRLLWATIKNILRDRRRP